MEEKHQLILINLDDNRSAAKMGGESGPTGRAMLFRRKKININIAQKIIITNNIWVLLAIVAIVSSSRE
jgi:hypothetical protein